MGPVIVIGAPTVNLAEPFLTSPPEPLNRPESKVTGKLALSVSGKPALMLVPAKTSGPDAALQVCVAAITTLFEKTWVELLLLMMPPARTVSCEPLLVKPPAVPGKVMPAMSQLTSTIGFVRVTPSNTIAATP